MKVWRGSVRFLVLVCPAIVAICVSPIAATQGGWGNQQVELLRQAPVTSLPSNSNTCYGTVAQIQVRSGGGVEACIMGGVSETRLARYRGANSQFAYAVARSGETHYTKLADLCAGYSWCGYGAGEDTLLLQLPVNQYRYGHAIVRHFSQYLQAHTVPEPHYSFEYNQPYEIIHAGSTNLPTGAVAVSANGRWAIVELLEYGFVRVDLRDGSYRRVIAPGVRYGLGADPSFELAISNDGRFVAIVGWRAGIDVYELDGACGDVLTGQSATSFSQGTISCRPAMIERQALFSGFQAAYMPRFSPDGTTLTLIVSTATGYVRAVLAPTSAGIAATPMYVALGDSFVSGEGETEDSQYMLGTNTATNKCHVSVRSYPYLLELSMNAMNRSCSGSRVQEVLQQAESIRGKYPTLLSVGVGGNDIDVMGKLKACIMPGTCEWALPENRMQTALEIQGLYQKLVAAFESIQQMYAQSTLIVVGYPEVINEAVDAKCRFPISALLDQHDRRYMNETVRYINEVLKSAAGYTGLQFIDVSGAYSGERLCDEQQTAMNGVRSGDDFAPISALESIKIIGAESFHPTPRGHELVAETIKSIFARDGVGVYCESCQFSPVDLTPPLYWREADGGREILPIAERFIQADAIGFGDSIAFSFPPGSFASESEVTLELHSDVRVVGKYMTAADGSLEGHFNVPVQPRGYHTVHAYGDSVSGIKIDRYQVVYVREKETSAYGAPPGGSSVVTGVVMPLQDARQTGASIAPNAFAPSLAVLGEVVKSPNQPTSRHTETYALYIWGGVAVLLLVFVGAVSYSIGRRQV